MATPATGTNAPPSPGGAVTSGGLKPQDRRLRLDDILKLMVADGLVPAVEAEALARTRTHRFEHPLEAIADRHWKTGGATGKPMTLEWLVEWLAGKLGIPYMHIDPLKIDLGAVTATMSNAYAERYRILPVAVDRRTLTVATSEPFVRSWADDLGQIIKLDVKFVFANPVDISATWANSSISRAR
jgi:general secretion pathway protein E